MKRNFLILFIVVFLIVSIFLWKFYVPREDKRVSCGNKLLQFCMEWAENNYTSWPMGGFDKYAPECLESANVTAAHSYCEEIKE